ncbi:hypothetical protein [Yoonia tamlensis]|uniref:hypothetical protein n=1 Tax=Yoonia tamlensis TaxID=390270 RepID=UPI0013F4D5D6|nr:hypothetical protein [Yoonia tamlensis]
MSEHTTMQNAAGCGPVYAHAHFAATVPKRWSLRGAIWQKHGYSCAKILGLWSWQNK